MYLVQPLAILLAWTAFASADASTTVVAVTSTTTVHATATNDQGACDNFVGACVVYGSTAGAPYTTTVYVGNGSPTTSPTPTSWVTSTTTLLATTTVSNSGACSGFSGACVVYGTDGNSAPTSTVYYASGSSSRPDGKPGNSQGYIGPKNNDGNGVIGAASLVNCWSWEAVLGLGMVALTFTLWT